MYINKFRRNFSRNFLKKSTSIIDVCRKSIYKSLNMQDQTNSPDLFESLPSPTESKVGFFENKQNDTCNWRGTHMNDIYKGKSPWHYYSPPISPSSHHTVLFDIPISPGCMPKSYFTSNACHWNNDHVKMPFSHKNFYPVKEGNEDTLKSRWDLIQLALLRPIANSMDLQEAIFSYNVRHHNYDALHYFCNEILEEEESFHLFNTLLPKIIQLALQLPELIPSPLPLLKQGRSHSVSLSQLQIASLIANGFLCTFPWRRDMNSYPGLNFNDLFQCCGRGSEDVNPVAEKLKCIIHYFRRVTENPPSGVVTFERRFVPRSQLPRWDKLENHVADIKMHVSNYGTIEDSGRGLLQVDFANCFVGGGVLGRGCVQEEIRFVTWPELLVSRLFTERLGPTEALHVIGIECFSKYTGYAETFHWAGDYEDNTPRDTSGRRRTTLVAIDALYYAKPTLQFSPSKMIRELNKAYVGYYKGHLNRDSHSNESSGNNRSRIHLPAVATGNWGCGAFRGNVRLKALLQIMACAAIGRDIVYYTFGNSRLCELLHEIHTYFNSSNLTISQLWRYLCRFNEAQLPARNLYPFIQQAHLDSITEARQKKEESPTNTVSLKKDQMQRSETFTKVSQTIIKKDNKSNNRFDEIEVVTSETEEISFDVIESSQPKFDASKDYISEVRLSKPKFIRNNEEMKKTHEEIKSFLYSSDEEDSTISAPSSSGLIQAADGFVREAEKKTSPVSKEDNNILNDSCEKMECESIEEKKKTPPSEILKGKSKTVKLSTNRKISDYFKVNPK